MTQQTKDYIPYLERDPDYINKKAGARIWADPDLSAYMNKKLGRTDFHVYYRLARDGSSMFVVYRDKYPNSTTRVAVYRNLVNFYDDVELMSSSSSTVKKATDE